jgi:hypothetical protein
LKKHQIVQLQDFGSHCSILGLGNNTLKNLVDRPMRIWNRSREVIWSAQHIFSQFKLNHWPDVAHEKRIALTYPLT